MSRVQFLGKWIIFIAFGILLAVGIAVLTGLSLKFSAGIATATCLLIYLMLDLRPQPNPGEATLIRLTKGAWHRRKK